MLQRLRRFMRFFQNLRDLPAMARYAYELVEAQADVAREDYRAAERRLLRIHGIARPEWTLERSPVDLLRALVSLRLGDPQAAADLAPNGVHHVGSMRSFANPTERAYLMYAGRLILEEATDQLGNPMTLEVGVEYDDLDIEKVRSSLRNAYPVSRSRYDEIPQIH